MYILSCICLSIVAIVCLIGCYSDDYPDNLMQRLGMAILGLGCVARVAAILVTQSVANDWFMVHGGMALFAGGTLAKVLARRVRRRPPRGYLPSSRWTL